MEFQIEKQARGTRILYGDSVSERYYYLNNMIQLAELYEFQGIQLPSLEPSEIYTDKAGKEILNQMYVFPDKKDRSLCLRPEATATIQLIADHFFQSKKETRLWYFEKCWRYERPQRGRYREFWQFGCEVLNPKTDGIYDRLKEIAVKMVEMVTDDYEIHEGVKRGLDYYTDLGFEIVCPKLGAQKQVCGGGPYKNGMGFAK